MSAILPVEDDLENREMLTQMVTAMGFDVIAAASAEDALRMLDQRNDVALAVCDIRLPGMDGIGFSALARERHPSLKLAFVTGDSEAADEAIRHGSVALLKPDSFTVLTRVIAEALGEQNS